MLRMLPGRVYDFWRINAEYAFQWRFYYVRLKRKGCEVRLSFEVKLPYESLPLIICHQMT